MDGDERKLHKVDWNGRLVELYCTDSEYPTLSRNEDFLRLLWDDQQRQRFGNLRLASSQSDERVELARQEAREAKGELKPRRVEWQGKVIEFWATDEDFAVWGDDENYLLDKWYKQEGWRLYQARKCATEGGSSRPPPNDQ